MSNKKSTMRKKFDDWKRRKTARRWRFITWIKQLFRCPICRNLMYIPTRWINNTHRAATIEHIVDIEFLSGEEYKNLDNLMLICYRCNHLKSHAKHIGSPFINLFNKLK